MRQFTDTELIDYTLKFDTDPVRVRLAKIMDHMPGFILQRLEDVGMNPETCLFENTYDPGDWISHLEGEVDSLSRELSEARERIEELEARTVADLIHELKYYADLAESNAKRAVREKEEAIKEREHMRSKLSMWAKLNGEGV